MKYMVGNMFDGVTDGGDIVICVTVCSVVKQDGTLVMGAGAALQAARRWPWLPREAGMVVSSDPNALGFKLLADGDTHVGLFQTKNHFKDPSTLALIQYSARGLADYREVSRDSRTFRLNFPGIGLGRLNPGKVERILNRELGHVRNLEIWSY